MNPHQPIRNADSVLPDAKSTAQRPIALVLYNTLLSHSLLSNAAPV